MFFKRQSAERDFDLLVLGGGSAAFAAAIRGAELGARVAVAEQGVIGGTCINRGCLPTKNLLYAAERYHEYRSNGFPGLPRGEGGLRFGEVIGQKNELVETMRKHKYWDILDAYPTIKFLDRPARLLAPHQAQIGEETITAENFLIATGASPAPLPVEGIRETPYLTYKEALELEALPRSMVVVGGGPIGLEIGQMYARFGTRVTILEALPRIAPLEEPEISDALRSYLEAEGIEIHTDVRVIRVGQGEGVTVVRAEVDSETRDFQAEKLLLAAGLRAPDWNDDETELQDTRPGPEAAVAAQQEVDRLRAAVLRLLPALREVLLLRRYHGLSFGEIAQVVTCSEGAARVRAFRAMQRLHELLAEPKSVLLVKS